VRRSRTRSAVCSTATSIKTKDVAASLSATPSSSRRSRCR
jgi:hypothetical protein